MSRLATLILALSLAACGMKGPLELPPKTGNAAKTQATGGDVSTRAPADSPASSAPSANKGTQP